jgi:hypothetical protein
MLSGGEENRLVISKAISNAAKKTLLGGGSKSVISIGVSVMVNISQWLCVCLAKRQYQAGGISLKRRRRIASENSLYLAAASASQRQQWRRQKYFLAARQQYHPLAKPASQRRLAGGGGVWQYVRKRHHRWQAWRQPKLSKAYGWKCGMAWRSLSVERKAMKTASAKMAAAKMKWPRRRNNGLRRLAAKSGVAAMRNGCRRNS